MIDERTVREMVRRVVLRTVQAAAHDRPESERRLITEREIEDATPGCELRVADADELNHLLQEDIACIDGIHRTGTHIVLSTIKETANIPIGETT